MNALLLAALALIWTPAPPMQAQEPWTVSDTEMAVRNAPEVVRCITWYESSNYPYAVGASGEQGPIQLLPSWLGGGEWTTYHYGAWTDLLPEYRSANDPFLTTLFLIWWGEQTGGTYWPWSAWRVWCR